MISKSEHLNLINWIKSEYLNRMDGKESILFKVIGDFPAYVSYRRNGKVSRSFHVTRQSGCFDKMLFNPPWNYGQYSDTWAARKKSVKECLDLSLPPCVDCYYEIFELIFKNEVNQAIEILKQIETDENDF